MNLKTEQADFERHASIHEAALLHFDGVEGWDVYNASIPFQAGEDMYIFGRVEKRAEWARSHVGLFRQVGRDHFALVPGAGFSLMEDPFVARVQGELVLGGVHVRYMRGEIDSLSTYFFRGTAPDDLRYFTTGPAGMKDIRLLDMQDGRVGVFSRPKSQAYASQTGRQADIGFAILDSLDALDEESISRAKPIEGVLEKHQWGGCNQAYMLRDGHIGVVGHISYQTGAEPARTLHYLNMSFVFHPEKLMAQEVKIIGSRACYPAGPAKKAELDDCAFTGGIVPRSDGLVDLYSGLGDCQVGRIAIDDPFTAHGGVVL